MFIRGWKEWSIAGAAALVVYSAYWMGGFWKSPTVGSVAAEDSYSMPRIQNDFYGRLDLSRRDVHYSRTYQTRDGRAVMAVRPNLQPSNPAKTVAKLDPKKINKPEKVDPKKKAAEDRKKAQALAKKKQQEERKRLFSLRTVGESTRSTVFDKDSGQNPSQVAMAQGFAQTPQNKTNEIVKEAEDGDADDKISAGQWYSMLQAQPTAANGIRFLKQKTNLGEPAYYGIVLKLLKDSQVDRQKLGLYLVKSDTSFGTFKFLVKLPDEVIKNTALNAQLQVVLKTYNQDKAKFPILALALGSSEAAVVLESQALINEALQKIGTGQVASTGSGGKITILTKNDFAIFKAALARLTRSSNDQVAANARTIYHSLWQDLGTQVADNK